MRVKTFFFIKKIFLVTLKFIVKKKPTFVKEENYVVEFRDT